MLLRYILWIAAFFALWMAVVSGRPMNDTLTSGLEVVQRVERATSDESPERKPADPDVLGMGFRNKRTESSDAESKPAVYRGLPVYQRTPKPTKPREPKNREAKKFLRLLAKTCEGRLPKHTLPKFPKDCRGN